MQKKKKLTKQKEMSNYDLAKAAKTMRLKSFRGVFMRDTLPKFPLKNESGILNLDSVLNPGTHWTAWKKRNTKVLYFDSFGNLRPPKEFIRYIGPNVKIYYNYHRKQKFYSVNCGQLCLRFLLKHEC